MISIIDDDNSVRRATRSLVRSIGFEALTFASAEEFLASPHRRDTSCIICDVQMPGLSGIDLYERLAHEPQATPMIFITAFSDGRVRQRAGSDVMILSKPFKAGELATCLQRAIDQHLHGLRRSAV
jgi:FixJ family two-component response regulator